MSADNGIYIGKFPTKDGWIEYRVIEAAAIENVADGNRMEQDAYRALYFGQAPATRSEDMALYWAKEKSKQFYTEYGIKVLDFDRPLVDMSRDDINVILGMEF